MPSAASGWEGVWGFCAICPPQPVVELAVVDPGSPGGVARCPPGCFGGSCDRCLLPGLFGFLDNELETAWPPQVS